MKTKLKLTFDELATLRGLLQRVLLKYSIEEMREQPHAYVMMSSVFEFFEKLEKRHNDYRLFGQGCKTLLTIALTRPQALALDIVLNPHDQDDQVVEVGEPLLPLQVGTYEWDLARRICEQVYKNYYE